MKSSTSVATRSATFKVIGVQYVCMVTDEHREAFDSMADTFNLLMGAKTGKLSTPQTVDIRFPGDKAEAIGSARHVCEEVEDAGYTASEEYVEPASGDGDAHIVRVTVEDA